MFSVHPINYRVKVRSHDGKSLVSAENNPSVITLH